MECNLTDCEADQATLVRRCREAYGGLTGWTENHWGAEELGSVRYDAFRHGRRKNTILKVHEGNLVLQDSVERTFAGKKYADMERGIYLVRGENVLLMGEIVSIRRKIILNGCKRILSLRIARRTLIRTTTFPSRTREALPQRYLNWSRRRRRRRSSLKIRD